MQVMGLLQGKVQHDTFVVVDSFALPVEGTETRVNAMEGANVFMCEYISLNSVSSKSCCCESHGNWGGLCNPFS